MSTYLEIRTRSGVAALLRTLGRDATYAPPNESVVGQGSTVAVRVLLQIDEQAIYEDSGTRKAVRRGTIKLATATEYQVEQGGSFYAISGSEEVYSIIEPPQIEDGMYICRVQSTQRLGVNPKRKRPQ